MIKIQKATKECFKEIEAIYSYYVKNTAATFEEQAPSDVELCKRWQDTSLPFLVAYIDNKIIGFANVQLYSSRSAYRFTVESSIYVHHKHNGNGVGTTLLEQLLAKCKEQNIKQVIARIAIWDGCYASIHLHKKLGFEERSTLTEVGYKFDKFVDTLLMQKRL